MTPGEWIALLTVIVGALLTLGGAGLAAYNRITIKIAVIETILKSHDKTMKRMEGFLSSLNRRKPKVAEEPDSDEADSGPMSALGEQDW